MKEWMKVIPDTEKATYERAGFMGATELGTKAALIVVDVTYGFTGSQYLTLEEAIKEYRTACGPASWEALPIIAELIQVFRELKLPIVFTNMAVDEAPFAGLATKAKSSFNMKGKYNEFPEAIAPREGEWILGKTKASAFFQTPLTSYLTGQGIDTVVICGVSTSGCVRASTVDSHSHGYTTFVVDDCCFDRSYFAHAANLFDMHAKYATVVSLEQLKNLMTVTVY